MTERVLFANKCASLKLYLKESAALSLAWEFLRRNGGIQSLFKERVKEKLQS